MFKDAYPTDKKKKGYHYPGTKEELEEALSKIPGAKQNKPELDVTHTKLPDGREISTYPKRSSSDKNDPKPGWQIKNPNTGKQEYKGTTNP